MEKVSMNNAFLKMAKEDAELVQEMKLAITELFAQAKKREMVYLAIEHNTKYLAMLAEAADSERVYAITKLQSQTEDLKRYKEENEDMQKKTKML
jgi:hypothetical protein